MDGSGVHQRRPVHNPDAHRHRHRLSERHQHPCRDGERRGQRRPRGCLRFPPWCYVRCSLIGPQPFQSGRLGDEYDVPRQLGISRRREMPPIPP